MIMTIVWLIVPFRRSLIFVNFLLTSPVVLLVSEQARHEVSKWNVCMYINIVSGVHFLRINVFAATPFAGTFQAISVIKLCKWGVLC